MRFVNKLSHLSYGLLREGLSGHQIEMDWFLVVVFFCEALLRNVNAPVSTYNNVLFVFLLYLYCRIYFYI